MVRIIYTHTKLGSVLKNFFLLHFGCISYKEQLIFADNQKTTLPNLSKHNFSLKFFFLIPKKIPVKKNNSKFWKNYNCLVALVFEDWGELN